MALRHQSFASAQLATISPGTASCACSASRARSSAARPLWDELFPAEQARIVQLLVESVDSRMHGVEVRLRPNGLAGLVREVAGGRRAAA